MARVTVLKGKKARDAALASERTLETFSLARMRVVSARRAVDLDECPPQTVFARRAEATTSSYGAGGGSSPSTVVPSGTLI